MRHLIFAKQLLNKKFRYKMSQDAKIIPKEHYSQDKLLKRIIALKVKNQNVN